MVFGLVVVVEGLRLIIDKDPYLVYDLLGPGLYVLPLGIGLMAVGIAHLIINYKKLHPKQKVIVSRENRIQLFSSIITLVIYIFLIGYVGYLVGTLIFFFLGLRVAGVRSWRTSFALTFIFTGAYYVVFVKFCEMVFPKGILF